MMCTRNWCATSECCMPVLSGNRGKGTAPRHPARMPIELYMTAMMHDAKAEAGRELRRGRIPGTTAVHSHAGFAGIFALDRSGGPASRLVFELQQWILNGRRYLKFTDGRRVKRVEATRYLGFQPNQTTDGAAELANRMRACVGAWRRLAWKHAECRKAQTYSCGRQSWG